MTIGCNSDTYLTLRNEVQEAVDWYSQNRLLYRALAKRVANIVREVLQTNKLNYHSVTYRAKTLESYREKTSKEIYKKPLSEIKDMAGIRIITYTDSDAKKVFDFVKETFDIRPEDVVDKTQELGVDRVGYRSIHCIGTLGQERLKLPENKIFKDMCFEIQVRSILQHAWAEFEHDRNYKFRGVLPPSFRRRRSILAGNLELLDREFDNLSQAIDGYSSEVKGKTEAGDLQISIDSTSLKAYLDTKFEPLIKLGLQQTFRGNDDRIIEELSEMNIKTIKELDDIFPKDFIEKKSAQLRAEHPRCAYSGVLRELMMIHDTQAYTRKARKNSLKSWPECGFRFLEEYGVNLTKYAVRPRKD